MWAEVRQWRIPSNVTERLQTVVETHMYLSTAAFMSDSERAEIIDVVAANPRAGTDLGAGLRKLRFGAAGRGKRAGARVVYLFGGEHMPIFLLAAFAKSARADLSQREFRTLKRIAQEIRALYRRS